MKRSSTQPSSSSSNPSTPVPHVVTRSRSKSAKSLSSESTPAPLPFSPVNSNTPPPKKSSSTTKGEKRPLSAPQDQPLLKRRSTRLAAAAATSSSSSSSSSTTSTTSSTTSVSSPTPSKTPSRTKSKPSTSRTPISRSNSKKKMDTSPSKEGGFKPSSARRAKSPSGRSDGDHDMDEKSRDVDDDDLSDSAGDQDAASDPHAALQGLMRRLGGADLNELLPPNMAASLARAVGGMGVAAEGRGRLKVMINQLRSDDESQQMQGLMEICDYLSMGTEDSLAGLSIEGIVPPLINLLNMEHNPDIMLLACRALSHLMEALPNSCGTIVLQGAVPSLCSKLLSIEYIDLAEQSLQALEKLSNEHPAALLRSGALMAVLAYLDFFSTGVQRVAVATAANICKQVSSDLFDSMVVDSIPNITQLIQNHDQKVVESAVLCFSRLVETFVDSESRLQAITSAGLLPNMVRLMSAAHSTAAGTTPISPGTLVLVTRMLANLCHGAPSLALILLQDEDVVSVLQQALVGSTDAASGASRSAQQYYEILNLINDLLPPLPAEIAMVTNGGITGRILMRERDRERERGRKMRKDGEEGKVDSTEPEIDPRERAFVQQPALLAHLGQSLFVVLTDMFTATVNPAVRHKCLSAITKILHFSTAEMLTDLLKEFAFSSFLAGLLASRDLTIVATALKMSELMLEKLPSIFSRYFRREGVVYEIERLARMEVGSGSSLLPIPPPSAPSTAPPFSALSAALAGASPSASPSTPPTRTLVPLSTTPTAASSFPALSSTPTSNAGNMFSLSTTPTSSASHFPFFQAHPSNSSSNNNAGGSAGLPSLSTTPSSSPFLGLPPRTSSTPGLSPSQAEELKSQVSALAQRVRDKFAQHTPNATDAATVELTQLRTLCQELSRASTAAQASGTLQQIVSMLTSADGISTFEFLCGGLPETLLRYLTRTLGLSESDTLQRANQFCEAFVTGQSNMPFAILVAKLQDALNKVERLPVIINEVPGSAGSGLKYLAQPFKIRLQKSDRSEDNLTRDCAPNVVLIEPLATVAAIEDFLMPKIKQALEEAGPVPASPSSVSPVPSPGLHSTSKPIPTRASAALDAPKRKDEPASERDRDLGDKKGKQKVRGRHRDAMDADSGSGFGAPATREISEDDIFGKYDDDEDDGGHGMGDVEGDEDVDDDDGGEGDEEMLGGYPASESESENVHDVKLGEESSLGTSTGRLRTSNQSNTLSRSLTSSGSASSGGSQIMPSMASSPATAVIQTPTASASASGKPSLSQMAQQPQQYKLVLYVDDKPLTTNTTIFQIVQKLSGNARGDASESVTQPVHRLWETVYTLQYRLLPVVGSASVAAAPRTPPHTSRSLTSSSSGSGISSLTSSLQGSEPADAYRPAGLESIYHPHMLKVLTERSGLPLGGSDVTFDLIALLRILYEFNMHWRGVMTRIPDTLENRVLLVPEVEFVNNKVAAKLMRQLQDPLALCGGALPDWCKTLTSTCGFLFPFECRRLYFCSTSFGIARALQTFQQRADSVRMTNDKSEFRVGRIQRQKVRISRSRILDSAIKVMDMYGKNRAILEVEYFNEVGTGLGPTLEFFTLVSRELQRRDLGMWYEADAPSVAPASPIPPSTPLAAMDVDSKDGMDVDQEGGKSKSKREERKDKDDKTEYVFNAGGLFPLPVRGVPPKKLIDMFRFMGSFMGKALLDGRLLDLPLSKPFLKCMLGKDVQYEDLRSISPTLAQSLDELWQLCQKKHNIEDNSDLTPQQKEAQIAALRLRGNAQVEDLCLDFTLPGHATWELKLNGANENVTLANLDEYLDLVVRQYLVDGVQAQFSALAEGFNQVLSLSSLRPFNETELATLLCGAAQGAGSDSDWTVDALRESTKCDHGYTQDSPAVRFLFEIMSEFTPEERRKYMLFVTGTPQLPILGFKGLSPRLTIVKKHHYPPLTADDYLPSVMSCTNYLKLPDYSTKEMVKQKLFYAIEEGQASFHLS
eukprot:TRINITY_DN1321_c0_g1_i2.p1 TRINITY_DN1321_c0_g1~~TRINITY_DN1321_c0_g1_i2.p1  ORF type:complete len:1980 (+),score=516.89 TRINITY_DN1321_c0_g1_i2:142-6081(+)